jgi:hypothetical protein
MMTVVSNGAIAAWLAPFRKTSPLPCHVAPIDGLGHRNRKNVDTKLCEFGTFDQLHGIRQIASVIES